MALFGSSRDASLLRRLNREFLGDIINQQCAYYKYNLEKTKVNVYGEVQGGKRFFLDPVLFNCLVTKGDQENPSDAMGVDFARSMDFAFLKDDMIDSNVVAEVGDIIMYYEGYFEVYNVINNQLWTGKDPQYPYAANPLNPGLENFGYNVSVICKTHYVSTDKVDIVKSRL